MPRKRQRKDRIQLAFDLDEILKAIEDKFIIKLSRFFQKLTNAISKKINDLPLLKKAITTESKKDISGLTVLLKKYYKDIGKATIQQTNKEISEITGQTTRIKIPDINAGIRYRAEQLALQKIRDYNKLLREKIIAGDGNLKDKKDFLRKLKKAEKVYINRHVKIVARMESITEANNQRLEAFKKSKYVKGVQFLAVLDKRTTVICRSRHSMVLKLDDPLLPNFKPPCHFGCRSLLSPVSVTEKNVDYTKLSELKSVPSTQFEEIAKKEKQKQKKK